MGHFNGTAFRLPGEGLQLFVNKSATLSKAPVVEDDDGAELQCDLPVLTNFELLSSFRTHSGNPVFCFKSKKTGLQVGVIKTNDGPIIKTFVTIPTSDHPDDLLPRVVDAVIDCGSEAYLWKGAVSVIGGPRLLHGAGSVASAEETIRYLETASPSALGILLPICMDHLLNPTMSESAFLTEVYHTDPKGEDGGRLYSAVETDERFYWEPKHREIERTLKRLLLRAADVDTRDKEDEGMSSVDKGRYLARLRDPGLRENEVLPFHQKYYRPDNMYIVICGHVDPGQVITWLDQVDLTVLANEAWDSEQQEEGLINKPPTSGSRSRIRSNQVAPLGELGNSYDPHAESRPNSAWGSRLKSCFNCGEGSSAFEDALQQRTNGLSPSEFPTTNVEVDMAYPAEDEDETTGIVEIAWLGPSWITDADEYVALPVLINFLQQYDTKCSLSLDESMKREDPEAADWYCVNNWVNMDGRNIFKLRFEQVQVPKLKEVAKLVSNAIETITTDKWDADEAIREFLDDGITWDWGTSWEWNGYFLSAVRLTKLMQNGQAENAEQFRMILDEVYALETLKSKDSTFWVNLLHKYLGKDKPRIVVRGFPSVELKEKEEADKLEREKGRREELGETGLLQLQETLQKAKQDLVRRRPKDLNSLPKPNADDMFVDVIRRYSNFQMVTGVDEPKHERVESINPQLQAQSPQFNLSELPLRTIFTNISVHQVQLLLIMDTTSIQPNLRRYLPLFLEAITKAPLKYPPGTGWAGKIRSVPEEEASGESDGVDQEGTEAADKDAAVTTIKEEVVVDEDGSEYVPHGVVAAEMYDGTRDVASSLGLVDNRYSGGELAFLPFISLSVQVEAEKYSEGVTWLRDLMFYSDLTDTRGLDYIRRSASRCVNLSTDWRDTGDSVVRALVVELLYRKDSNSRRRLPGSFAEGKFLQDMATQLDSAQANDVNEVIANSAPDGAGQQGLGDAGKSGEIEQAVEVAGKLDTATEATEQHSRAAKLEETMRNLRELQDRLRRNVDGLVIHVMGDFRRISKANGDLQLDKPWREIFLPLCGSGANLATPFVVSDDVSEQRDSEKSSEDDGEPKIAGGSAGRGIVLHAAAEDDPEFVGDYQLYLRQVVQVQDFNPWTDLDESVSLEVLTQHLIEREEKVDQALRLDDAGESQLAYNVRLEWTPNERLVSLSFCCDTPDQVGDAYLAVSNIVKEMLENGIPEDDDEFAAAKRTVISGSLFRMESAIYQPEACALAPFRGLDSPGEHVKRISAKVLSMSPSDAIARAGKHLKLLFDSKNEATYCAVVFDKRSEKTAREISEDIRNKTGLALSPFESYEELFAGLELAY